MANNKMIVEERQREIGNFLVGRLLPFRKKRQVGPFTFIDHMGPAEVGPGQYMGVDQHPHIGLSTLTYLLEGEVEHRDSIGSHEVVKPGDVAFMTAGKGVTHTERTPEHLRDGSTHQSHGYQIWVALPKELEEMEPRFDYFEASTLPTWQDGDLNITLVAGQAFGKEAPLKGFSPLFMVDVSAIGTASLDLRNQIKGEVAIVVVQGSVRDDDEVIEAGQMLISKTDDQCSIELEENSRVLLFGGEAFPEERYLLWNFVSSDKAKLEQAKEDWQNKRFPKIDGDDTYIPFPS